MNIQIDKIVSLMSRDDSVDAPQDSVKWAMNLYRTRSKVPGRSIVQKIFATLQIDLAPGKAAFGERSASTLKARQLLYSAGDAAVDLRISDFAERLDIHGQILGDGYEYCPVKLKYLTNVIETTTDDFGEFQFRSVPVGNYTLTVTAADKEIIIQNIELQ